MRPFIFKLCFLISIPLIGHAESLSQIYTLAQSSSMNWKARMLENEKQQLSGEVALGALLPSASFKASQSSGISYYGSDPINQIDRDSIPFAQSSLSMNMSVPLYSPSALRSYEAAELSEKIAAADYILFQNSYALELATRYFDVLKKEKSVGIAQQQLVMRERLVKDIQLRYEVGIIARTDLKEAQAALSHAKAAVIAAHLLLSQAQSALKNLISIDVSVLNDLSWNQDLYLPNRSFEQQKHISIAKADLATQYYQKQVEVYRAALLPQLSGFSSCSVSPLNQTISRSATSISAGLSLSWAPPNGMATTTQVEQASYALQSSQAQLIQSAIENATHRDLYAQQCYSLSRQIEAQREAVIAAAVYSDAVNAGFEAGQNTTTDVLEAQYYIEENETTLYALLYDALLMHLKLGLENSYSIETLFQDIDAQLGITNKDNILTTSIFSEAIAAYESEQEQG